MKPNSRFLAVFLSVLICLSTISVSAYGATSGQYTYTVNADGSTCTITNCNVKNAEVLEIPETLDGYKVIAFNAMLAMTYGAKTVVLPKTLTSYNRYTFQYTDLLENIVVAEGNSVFSSRDGILFNKDGTALLVYPAKKAAAAYAVPDGVERIGEFAFAKSSITAVEFPSSVKSIDFEAFCHCDNLKSVYMPDTVEDLGKSVFSYCTSLESARLPAGLTFVPEGLFQECRSLRDVQIPSGVTKIGDSAFAYTAFTEVVIPDGVTEIAVRAFQGCNLTKAVIPVSVTSIDKYTFESRYKKNLTIYGMQNSYAQTYAQENEINFIAIDAPVVLTPNRSTGDTIIKTAMLTESGESGENFTVTFPAETVIPWGTLSTNLPYTAESHLGYRKALAVSVSGSGALTFAPGEGVLLSLPYVLSGETAFTGSSPVIHPAAEKTLSMQIEEDAWANAPVEAYADVLTFMAEVVSI